MEVGSLVKKANNHAFKNSRFENSDGPWTVNKVDARGICLEEAVSLGYSSDTAFTTQCFIELVEPPYEPLCLSHLSDSELNDLESIIEKEWQARQ